MHQFNKSHDTKLFHVLQVFFIVFLSFKPIVAQEKLLPVFHFNQLTTADGLPTSEIRSGVVRDKQGFLWIGTVKGLVRYDGYSCKVYGNNPEDSTSISSISIISLLYDSKCRLWIGTFETGLSLYDPIKDSFINFLPRPDDPKWLHAKSISVIHEDHNGNIWLGTWSAGIVRVSLNTKKEETCLDSIARHIQFNTISPGGKRNDIMDLKEFGDDKIIAASLGGLFCIDYKNQMVPRYAISEKLGHILDTNSTTSLFWESPEKLWIGTWSQGLFLYNIKEDKVIDYHKKHTEKVKSSDDPITDIQMDQSRHLWVGTYTGLDLFDISRSKYIDYLNFDVAPTGKMFAIKLSVDNTGTFWITTGDHGIYFLTRKSFRFPNYGLSGVDGKPKEMETIDKCNDGSYWIGTEGKVVKLDLAALSVKKVVDLFKGEKSGYSLVGVFDSFTDARGNLWYGTWGLGLYKFEPEFERITHFRYSKQLTTLVNSDVCRSITVGKDNSLLIASYDDGFIEFNTTTRKFRKIVGTSASHVMRDADGKIWIANERDGLFVYNPATEQIEQFVHEPNNAKSLSYSRTIQSYQDSQGRIWIGSRNVIELWEPATRSFKHYPNKEFKDAIYARPLGSDLKCRLWVSYDGALGILDPATGIFTSFGYSSGLCGPLDMKLLEDGRVLLVGDRGMNIINPESLFTTLQPPPLVITRMTVNDTIPFSPQRISSTQTIQFSHEQNVIEFEFAAIKPGEASLIEYQYKLDGLEKTWINPNDRRFVRYPGLNPGNYIFRVKASSTRNEWQTQEIALAITIFPPWWQTWWAYTLYAVAFIGFLYVGYRIRLRQVQLKQQVEMEHFQTEHLAEVDRLKSHFFSNISHEFRTPLTLILGPAEEAMDQIRDASVRRKLYLIKDNAKKLLGLVNQLLDFSRIESGVMKLQVSSDDIVRFLRRVVMSFESWAEKKKITLEFKSDIEANESLFDPDKLEKIMNNLISNALKFTKEGGKVDVGFSRDITRQPIQEQHGEQELNIPIGNRIIITVRDTGPGISSEHLSHIFDCFYRVDDTHTTEGTGIGLALVKELVQLHHGTITADSEQGKGSIFTIALPIDKSTYAKEEIAKSPPQHEELEQYESTESAEEIKSAGVTKSTDGKPIILIIEDNADLRKYICEFLEKDYAIREARDGEMGYNAAIEIIPDLVISDIMMPKMDGIKLCRTLKQDVRTSHVPVILLTARAGTDSKIEGLETGADDYITKPFDVRELFARVKNLIEQRRQLRQRFSAGVVLKPGDVAVTSLDDDLLKRAMAAVEQNIGNEEFSVEDLAREACLSRRHLHRKLHALTNLSPGEFIQYIRLQRARELLEENAGSVADISYQVGFGSPSYFSTCFHERFDISPSEVHRKP